MTRWNAPNSESPTWLLVLLDEPPACFAPPEWELYLGGVRDETRDDPALRRRLERGGVPAYCESCTAEHRAAMTNALRCHPLRGYK